MNTEEKHLTEALKHLYKAIDAIGQYEDACNLFISNLETTEAITSLHDVMFDIEEKLGIERKH